MSTRPEVRLAAMTTRVRFVVVDTETTPSATGNHVLTLAALSYTAAGGHGTTLTLTANPGVPIENTYKHNITDADVADALPFDQQLHALDAALRPAPGERLVFVAHSAGFDLGVLLLEYSRAAAATGLPADFPTLPVLDTLLLAQHLGVKHTDSYKLGDLARALGITERTAHQALADAQTAADLLGVLLEQAAAAGYDDLDTLRAAIPGGAKDTTDYKPHPPVRTLRDDDDPFTHQPPPDPGHLAGHTPLPPDPTQAQLDAWTAHARECVAIRCPLLPDKADTVTAGHHQLLTALLPDLDTALATPGGTADTVTANTILGVVNRLAARGLRPADAIAHHDTWAPRLRGLTRCVRTSTRRIDACPDCRAGNPCPADTWHAPLAVAVLDAGDDWPMPTSRRRRWAPTSGGLLAVHAAAGRTELAGYAAWLVADAWLQDHHPGSALNVARLAASLGLVEPRLVRLDAFATARGDLDAAITLLDTAMTQRTSDRAWRDLATYLAALRARQADRQRPPAPIHGDRTGHTRPPTRTPRRRFTPARVTPAGP